MGAQFNHISDRLRQFIEAQKVFFVATAPEQGRINLSPKGMDTFRVVSETEVLWLNVTGSGNETAAHVQENGRMTIMFTAFEGPPMILRIYGTARAIHHNDSEWQAMYERFSPVPGARQIFSLAVEMVQTSCGMAVPFFDYAGERDQLIRWAEKKGQAGVEDYWADKNQLSIDGLPTHISEKNL
jgi:hypothetical protein